MSMSNAAEAALLDLLFLNTDWANIGDAGGLQNSAAAGSFYIALHTSDPGEAGDQTTNEISYTGYARVAVARSGAGFSRSGSTISNVATVQFGECTAGSGTAGYFSIGTAPSGAGQIVLSGSLTASRAISAGITPLFSAGNLTATVD
jgi:hypothetical protein